MTTPMTDEQKAVLTKAIATYGELRQVVVAMEELCELTSALAKFIRYNNVDEAVFAIRPKIVEEYADVMVMMESMRQIFFLDAEDVAACVESKIQRLSRWLDKSDNLKISTEDR